jgi:TRAP-type transport system small permease protein
MRYLASAYHLLFRIAEYLLALVALVICGAVIIAVFSRYVMNASVPWSDELPALALIWLTFLGSAVLARQNEHMAFDGVSAALPVSAQRVLEVFNGLLILGFLAILVYYSWLLTIQTWNRAAVTLPISMGWVRLIVPVSGALMMLVYAIRVIRAALGLPLAESEEVH